MISKQLTASPEAETPAGRFETNRMVPAHSEDAGMAKAAALLFGAEMRGWLTAREMDYLDTLAPDNGIAFLVAGRKYLHPREVELFPLDLVEAAIGQGGDAVFSHRYESKRDCGPHACRVYTGMIGYVSGEPLVLGMFGPDDPLDREILQDAFTRTIGTFRTAHRSVQQVGESLGAPPSDSFRLILNRASGRVISADERLCERIGRRAEQVVSREYGELAPYLKRLMSACTIKMNNLAAGCLNLACVTFSPAARTAASAHRRLSASRVLAALRGETAGIITAADHLANRAGKLAGEDIAEIAVEICRAAERMDRRLVRHQIIANYSNLEPIEVNLFYQLEQAVDRIADGGTGVTIKLGAGMDAVTATAPAEAFELLFESILETHLFARGTSGETAARISRDHDSAAVHVTFKTVLPDSMRLADLERVWYQDTEALARCMRVNVSKNLILESNTIVTRVTLNAQEGTNA